MRTYTDTKPAAPAGAFELLASLLASGFKPERLDEMHDYLRLLGVVLGQMTLLEVAVSSAAKSSSRVAAARALLDIHESPESVAERLKRSPFTDLSPEQLERMVQELRAGHTDIPAIITQLKKEGSDGERQKDVLGAVGGVPSDAGPSGSARGDAGAAHGGSDQ